MPDEHSVSLGQKILHFLLRAMPQHFRDDLLSEADGGSVAACQAEQLKRGASWPKT
ncbi:MAG: hypothetical protein ACRYG8_36060 [Janthinobacterium lividum]